MPRRKAGEPPKYRLHKARGLAVVTIRGKDHYLGEYGSPKSLEQYAILIAQDAQERSTLPSPTQAVSEEQPVTPVVTLKVADLTLRYDRYAGNYYVKNGRPTHQVDRIKIALRAMNALFAATPAREFGPKKLKAVRDYLTDRRDLRFRKKKQSLSRNYVNALVRCIVRMFKWAVAEELLPPDVHDALADVEGLKLGRTKARETVPVRPAQEQDVEAVLPHVAPQVAAMIQLQRLSGMRPCEVRSLRPGDITMRVDGVWVYRPEANKNAHHGQERIVLFGPRAQEVLRPWLGRSAEKYCFSPREAVATKREEMRARRKTPVQPSQVNRAKPSPKRGPGDRYSRNAYRQAIQRACELAGVPVWKPNQLRHLWGTEVRNKFGLEASQVTLGHTKADTTQLYAERNLELAARVVREVG